MIQEIGFAPDTAVEGNELERLVRRKTPGVLFGIGSRSRRLLLVAGSQAETT